MKHFHTFDSFLNEQEIQESNRWWNALTNLVTKLKLEVKWLKKLETLPEGVKDAIKQHFPNVSMENLAILFKKDAGDKWKEATEIIGTGVKGSDKTEGEFILINSATA